MRPERFMDSLLARRRSVVLALAAATVLAAASLAKVNFDNSIESWFLETDPGLNVYNTFTSTFGADQIVIVGIFADDVFDADVLAVVDDIAARAARLEFVARTRSIIGHPFAAPREGRADADEVRAQVLGSPLQRDMLLSPDATATAVVIHYSRAGNGAADKREFVTGLAEIVDEATAGRPVEYAITGVPVVSDAGQARNSDDMRTLVPAMILLIMAIAYAMFRQLLPMLLPLAAVGVAVIWAFGFMAVTGWPMSMMSIILVPLVLAVGVAHSIHMIAAYRAELGRGASQSMAVRDGVARVLKPCLFTGITTMIGLLSLLVSELRPVREFAVTAAIGILAALVASVTLVPLGLARTRPAESRGMPPVQRAVVRLLERVDGLGRSHTLAVIGLALLAAVASAWLASRVEAGLDPMSWIPHEDPIRRNAERIDAAFGGALALEFLVTSSEGRVAEPAVLRRMEEFQAWLVGNTVVARAHSLADFVKEAARLARDRGAAGFELPRSQVVTDGLLAALERGGELESWMTPDRQTARIAARIPLTSAQRVVAEIPRIEEQVRVHFADAGVDVRLTGQAVLSGKMQLNLLDSQLQSFTLALVLVSLVMIVLLRSLSLGLLAMVPNLLPIGMGLAAMALFDIALNPGTVMVAAVALGIVVDDTVHLMNAFERKLRRSGDVPAAVRAMLLDVGPPVVVTSVLLAAGFSMLLLGNFLPTRQVGGLIALIAVLALMTDLVFLPALLRVLPPGAVSKFLRSARSSQPAG